MLKDSKYFIKASRERASLTQEQAAELLNIGVRTLSDYENGKQVNERVLAEMAIVYKDPSIIYLNLKVNTEYGRFLPSIEEVNNSGEMGYKLLTVQDDLSQIFEDFKPFCDNPNRKEKLPHNVDQLDLIIGKLFSIKLFGQRELLQ